MASDTIAGDTTTAAGTTWCPATNWAYVRGTLANSITFESSLSPIDGDGEITNLNSIADRPLILRRYAPDTGPCEITVNFTQKHELQQIYVRSTGRVYEIYYESDLQSGKEYLCTVRCGIAARDEEVLHTTDNKDAVSANLKEPHENASEKKLRNDCNRTTSEDEWIEVKVPDPSVLDEKDNSLPLSAQVYYEATAQISDAHPCRSVTIRLLSIQSRNTVFVDEIYVFADPVDSTDSENQVNQTEKSSGNSLMAMLLPTLLQMSKTKGASATRAEDKRTSEASRTNNVQESASEANVANKAQEEGSSNIAHHEKIELQDVYTTGVDTAKLLNLPQDPVGESKTHNLASNDRMERALDQLFSRMGRIEDLFLRFEDNLLKPISSIEARLHRVEQQLEVLTNKQKNSEQQLYTRFYAPNFSFVQSDSNSFNHSEIDYPPCEEFGSNVKSTHFDVQCNHADYVSDSVNATRLLPSLVVTAPEFPNCDDEEGNQESARSTESSADEPRKVLTVDDALASALAGFISSIPSQLQNHIPSLSIKAPAFSNEDIEVDREASPRGQLEIETDGAENINGSLSNASGPFLDGEKNVERSLNEYQSEETAEEVGGQCLHYEGEGEDEPSARPVNIDDERADDDKAGTQNFERAEGTECGEVSTEANSSLLHNETDVTGSATSSADSHGVAENKKVGPVQNKDILHDVLGVSHASASVVDFESPVLDVKFISQNSLDSNFTLEALLSDSPEPESKFEVATCVNETHGATASDEHCDLISVEDGEKPVGLVTNSQILVDFDYCSLPQEHLCSESGTPMASTSMPPCSHETFPASLL